MDANGRQRTRFTLKITAERVVLRAESGSKGTEGFSRSVIDALVSGLAKA